MRFSNPFERGTLAAARMLISSLLPSGLHGKMKRPCLHCPYRKDRKNWLDFIRTFFNVTLIHHGKTQDCHMAMIKKRHLECYGARVCLEGGNEQIVSPTELATREFSTDMVADYGGSRHD